MNKIIFFINCHVNRQYDSLLNQYLEDFEHGGIQDRDDVKLIFVVVGQSDDSTKIMNLVKNKLPRLFGSYDEKNVLTSGGEQRFELRLFDNSRYEHVGIEAAWKEAMASEDEELITYCHCRGIGHTHPSAPEMNGMREIFTLAAATHIVKNYTKIEKIFKENPDITRVGAGQSPLGWMWFNFWTCKSSYLKTRPKPDINGVPTPLMKKNFDQWVKDRHYYEAWLGDDGKTIDQGYSTCISPHKGITVSGPQVIAAIRIIINRVISKTK